MITDMSDMEFIPVRPVVATIATVFRDGNVLLERFCKTRNHGIFIGVCL